MSVVATPSTSVRQLQKALKVPVRYQVDTEARVCRRGTVRRQEVLGEGLLVRAEARGQLRANAPSPHDAVRKPDDRVLVSPRRATLQVGQPREGAVRLHEELGQVSIPVTEALLAVSA